MTTTITQNSNQSVIPVTVTNNVTKGDYVYQYGANIGWPKPANVGAGGTSFLLNPTLQTSNAAIANAKSVTTSPMAENYTYTGSTVALNTVTTATTSVDATSQQVVKSAGLVGGNFVTVYMSATNTLSAKVLDQAGTQQGSTLTITTACTAGANNFYGANKFGVCGMPDGGYVVVFKNSSDNHIYIARANASNALTLSPTIIDVSARASSAESPNVCSTPSGGYFITYFNPGANGIGDAIYTANNVFVSGTFNVVFLTSFGDVGGSSNTALPIPVCFQNGEFAIFVAISGYDSSFSTLRNTFGICRVSPSTGFQIGSVSNTQPNVTGNGAIDPTLAVCGSTTEQGRYFAFFNGDAVRQPVFFTGIISGGITRSDLNIALGTVQRQVAITPTSSGTAALYYVPDTNNIRTVQYNASGTQTVAPVTLATATTFNVNVLNAFSTGWKTIVCHAPTTTNLPSFFINQATTITNGAAFASTPYTPAQNYYLIGVAQNTATSGNTCWVQTEGVAQLGAGFASGNLLFDYVGSPTNSTAKSAIKGNSGTTSGTSVILKGLK